MEQEKAETVSNKKKVLLRIEWINKKISNIQHGISNDERKNKNYAVKIINVSEQLSENPEKVSFKLSYI